MNESLISVYRCTGLFLQRVHYHKCNQKIYHLLWLHISPSLVFLGQMYGFQVLSDKL